MSACSANRSVILPLPSSPHWAPTMTMPAISRSVYGASPVPRAVPGAFPECVVVGLGGTRGQDELSLAAVVRAEHGKRLAAHLVQARNRSRTDLGDQGVVVQVGRQHERLAVLVAGVDDRVELLEHPRRAL